MFSANIYGWYNYVKDVCHVNQEAFYLELYKNVSLLKCKLICHQLVSENCSGIFWNRLEGSCWLTSFTGDHTNSTDCESIRKDVVFFRRRRMPCQ